MALPAPRADAALPRALLRHARAWQTDATGEDLTRGYTLEQMADDVAELVAKLGHGRFHFVGLSIGSMIGQVLALRHPNMLDRLVLACAGTGKPNADQQKMWDDRVAAIAKDGVASQVEGTLARWLSAEFRAAEPETTAWIADLIRATPAAGYIGAALAIKRMDIPGDRLETLRLPTLCIAGEKDPGAPVAAVSALRDRIQGARLAVIEGGYHLCNVEKPQAFNEGRARLPPGRRCRLKLKEMTRTTASSTRI